MFPILPCKNTYLINFIAKSWASLAIGIGLLWTFSMMTFYTLKFEANWYPLPVERGLATPRTLNHI